MKKYFYAIKKHANKIYTKLNKLPKIIKLPLGILLILLGLVNIVNPFLNGIFIIIIGTGLLSSITYDIIKDAKKNSKK